MTSCRAKTVTTYSLGQATEVFWSSPSFLCSLLGLLASMDVSFQDLASLLGFICFQLNQGKDAHAKRAETASSSCKIRGDLEVGATSPCHSAVRTDEGFLPLLP